MCEPDIRLRGLTGSYVGNLQANGLLVLASCWRLQFCEQRHAGVAWVVWAVGGCGGWWVVVSGHSAVLQGAWE